MIEKEEVRVEKQKEKEEAHQILHTNQLLILCY